MSLPIRKTDFFLSDLETQFRWYEGQAGWDVAWRYLLAVDQTLEQLAQHPDLGWLRHFRHPELMHVRSYPVARPYNRHMIFYRHGAGTLDALRIMHGARDLPSRLGQPPGNEDA